MSRRNFLKGLAASAVAASEALRSSEAHAREATLLENGHFNLDAAEEFGFQANETTESVKITIKYYDGDLFALPLPPAEMEKHMRTSTFVFPKGDTTKIDIRSQIGGVAIRGLLKDGSVRKIFVRKDHTYGYMGAVEEMPKKETRE